MKKKKKIEEKYTYTYTCTIIQSIYSQCIRDHSKRNTPSGRTVRLCATEFQAGFRAAWPWNSAPQCPRSGSRRGSAPRRQGSLSRLLGNEAKECNAPLDNPLM